MVFFVSPFLPIAQILSLLSVAGTVALKLVQEQA